MSRCGETQKTWLICINFKLLRLGDVFFLVITCHIFTALLLENKEARMIVHDLEDRVTNLTADLENVSHLR